MTWALLREGKTPRDIYHHIFLKPGNPFRRTPLPGLVPGSARALCPLCLPLRLDRLPEFGGKMTWAWKLIFMFTYGFFCSVIGLPGEEDWPRDVALPRQAFHSKSPQPIEKFVTDIDEQGRDLLLVSSCDAELVCTVQVRDLPSFTRGGGHSICSASHATATQGRSHYRFHFHTGSSFCFILVMECLQFL